MESSFFRRNKKWIRLESLRWRHRNTTNVTFSCFHRLRNLANRIPLLFSCSFWVFGHILSHRSFSALKNI
jgi:hypothetical protein